MKKIVFESINEFMKYSDPSNIEYSLKSVRKIFNRMEDSFYYSNEDEWEPAISEFLEEYGGGLITFRNWLDREIMNSSNPDIQSELQDILDAVKFIQGE